jgi:hypothetical protein
MPGNVLTDVDIVKYQYANAPDRVTRALRLAPATC